MRIFDRLSLIKFSPLLIVAIIFFVLAFINPPIFKGESSEKVETTKIATESSPEIKVSTGSASNSVNVNVGDSQTVNGKDSSGTCTVTKNGKTEVVPADSVNVNEKSSGDINVKVDCNNSTNTSNQSSVKNNVNVKVNTSN